MDTAASGHDVPFFVSRGPRWQIGKTNHVTRVID
jgi:hypothetical protein